MKRPSFEQFAIDLKRIAVLSKRFTYVNTQLPVWETAEAHAKLMGGIHGFATKYSMADSQALRMAHSVSDACDVGF